MNGYDLVRSQSSHDEMAKKVKDFFDNGGTIGGAIKGVTGTTGHRFLEHTGVFNGRNALLRTSTADMNNYPAIINMIEDLDTPNNKNGFVFTLGNGKDGDQYKNSFLRPAYRAYGSGSMNLGSVSIPWDDLWLGQYSKAQNGHTRLPNGFILQWIEVDVNFATAQSQDISVKMPMGFSSGGAFGFANCITNSVTAKYATTAVTTTNSLAGTFILRVATTQTINTTLKFKVFTIGY